MERVPARALRPEEPGDRTFLDDFPVLVASGTTDGHITDIGGPWKELLGWTAADLTAGPFIEFIHPEDVGATIAEMVRLNEGQRSIAFRNRFRARDGSWLWLQWHAAPSGTDRVVSVATDVTAAVAHERELERRRRVVEVVSAYQRPALSDGRSSVGMDDAVRAAADIVGAESAAILTIETTPNGTRLLEGVAAHGPDALCTPGEQRPVIEGAEMADDGNQTMLEAASVVARFGRTIITTWTDGHLDDPARELLVVPLTRDRTVGIAAFARHSGSFTRNDIEVIAPLLGAFASAIEHDRTEALETSMSAEVTRLSSMLGTMLERTQFMVIVTDAHGRIEMMNDTAIGLVGDRAAVEEHRSIDSLLAPEPGGASLAASLVGFENGAEESAWTLADHAGRRIDVVVTASPIFAEEGTLRGWMLICRTAEQRVRAEHERIERARLAAQVELLKRREQQLAALADATQYVMASHTHREALDVIEHFLPRAFGTGRATLLRVAGATRFGQGDGAGVLQANECWAVRTGRTFHSERGASVRCGHVDGDRRATCAPIGDGQIWSAVVMLDSDPTEDAGVTAAGDALVDDVARQLSNAMSNLRLRRALEEQAYRDPLTGVGNRRAAEQALALATARHRSHGEPFAVVMVDLDHFKTINDLHGHEVGDDVLVAFAEFLRAHVREEDCVTRIGGEEFLLILRDIPASALERTLEALRLGVAALTIGPDLRITASFGGIHVEDGDVGADDLVAAADQLMYTAKHGGRDRVEVAAWDARHAAARSDP